MRHLLLFIPSFILLACKGRVMEDNKPGLSLRDSLVRQHLAWADSADFYDTTEYHFRLLKAYINNDSSFFIQMKQDLETAAKYKQDERPPALDSCVFPKKISDLLVDEAYRLTHKESFCYFGQTITITRTGDSIRIHYVEYILPSWDGIQREITFKDGRHYVMKDNCVKVKETFKDLTKKDWEDFERKLDEAEYWGLRTHYPVSILDGSDWEISAYIKEPSYDYQRKTYKVVRRVFTQAFMNIGLFMLKLSGQTTLCGDMR